MSVTITINIPYFEENGIRCPHCKQIQLTPENIQERWVIAGRRVYLMECPTCRSNSTIQEKADEEQTQERSYEYHRPKYRR